jgi:uncharacterized protein with FMN-binding domain
VAAGSLAVALIFAVGYVRTHEAAERLTRTSSRPRSTHAADVQQVLDMARFTPGPPGAGAVSPGPAVDAPPSVPIAAPAAAVHAGQPTVAPQALAPSTTSAGPARPDVTAVHEPSPPAAITGEQTGAETPAAVSVPDEPAVPLAAAVPDSAAPPPAPVVAPVPAPFRDGTYTGWGYCRHGEIQATIIVEHGRITSAEITGCYTRYTCDWIAKLPPQVVSRQSQEVDFVSGATESADAFYYAVGEALKKAR